MTRSTLTLFGIGLVATSALVAGCSNGPDPLASGGDYSVYDAIGELPSSFEDEPIIFTGDLARAGELAGLERPTDPGSEEVADWVISLSGGTSTHEQADALVPLPPPLSFGSPAEKAEQVGWSVVDVDAFVSTADFLVASGEFDDDTLDEDLVEVDDEIVTDVEGEDHEEHPDRPTAFDSQGAPTRFAEDDGRIAAASETDAVREWLNDEASLADGGAYADVAKALDEHDPYSAVLALSPSGKDPYDLVGLGWSEDDDAPLVSAAYHFDSEAAADDNVDSLRERFESEPLADHLEVDDAGTEGSTVVVTTRPEEGEIAFLLRALTQFGPPFH